MIRHTSLLYTALIAAVTTSQVRADEYFWEGGSGTFTDSKYYNGTTAVANQPPGTAMTDFIHIGLASTVTFSGGNGIGVGRLRVGHNVNPASGTYEGAGTLTVSDIGTEIQITGGAAAPNAGIWVGNGHNGELNIENGATVSSNRLVVVGAGNNANPTGTLNVRSGGSLRVLDGNLSIADRSGNSGNGIKGVVNLSDSGSSISIEVNAGDLIVGARSRTGVFNQTDGTVTVGDSIEVANANSSSTGSTLSISGGSITTGVGGTGNFFVGRGSSVDATVNISGSAVVNVGNRYLMGGSDTPNAPAVPTAIATGSITNHTGGTLNTDLDLRIADTFISPTSEATYNLSGTGIINTNVSAGTTGNSVIGRQGIGQFFQSGGTANFNSPLIVGSRESATTTTATGFYEISAGDLNINAPTSATWTHALSIAPNGTGEFRVVGDDATIDVTGDFAVSNTANGAGTLAFELETGDLLSLINVTGTATLNLDSILSLDVSNSSPTQGSYDVLTALDIIDNGLDFTGPAGWSFEIVSGGNGEILRLVQGAVPVLTGDHNQDGVVDAADYVMWRKTDVNGATGYSDWVEQFGQSAPGSGGQSRSGQVPEPAAALLIAMGWFAVASQRGRWFV
jgi:hypothetical protein